MMRFFMMLGLFVFGLSNTALALNAIQPVTASGVTAWMMEDRTNPIVSIRFSFEAGSVYDPADKVGLARLAAATMDEGAGDLSSQMFQSQLEEASITLRFNAGANRFSGEILTLKENLETALHLAQLALTSPRFDETAVTRIKAQIDAGLRQSLEDPNRIARDSLAKQLFGDHPYGRGTLDLQSGLPNITQADLTNFVKDLMVKETLFVGIVGDVDAAETAQILDRLFGQLPQSGRNVALDPVEVAFSNTTTVIEKDIPQTSIIMVQKGIDRHDPDFYAAYVLNYILGGGSFSSRLYDEVREKRGLAYSVYSYLTGNDLVDYWAIGAGTQNARVAETVSVVRDEWRKAFDKGVTQDEVTNAKTYLSGSFPLRFSSSDTISAILLSMQEDDLPLTFLETRNQQVEAVTWEDVNRVARQLLTPDQLKTVLVGKPEGF